MTKWVLLALVVIIVALGAMTWVGMDDTPTTTRSKAKPAPAAKSVSNPSTPAGPRAAVATPPSTEDAPADEPIKHTEAEIQHEAIERFVGGAVPQELYQKAASCYQGEQGRGGVEVQYALRVADGTASVSGASIVSSDLGNRRLEDCVVSAISDHSWAVSEGFEVDEPRESMTFSITGLRKRSRQADDSDSQ